MTTLRADLFGGYDVALDGIGMQLEPDPGIFNLKTYDYVADDLGVERTDTSIELTENKLDALFWGSSRSFHLGAGQKRFNVPRASDPSAFLSSKGIDISEKGQATLLKATVRLAAQNTFTAELQRLAVAGDKLYVVTAQPNLTQHSSVITAVTTPVSTGTETSKEVKDLASDGTTCYIALSTDGIHTTTGSTGVHYSDVAATVLAWAHARLYAIAPLSGRDALYEVGAGALANSTARFSFPSGETAVQIAELGPMVYIATKTGVTRSQIYFLDGNNNVSVAITLPKGDIVTSITPYLGAGMLIACQRYISATQSIGVVYVALPSSTGHLYLLQRELLTRGTASDSLDYSMVAGAEYNRSVFFAWPQDDASGLGVFFPETNAYARHLFTAPAVTGTLGGIIVWRGKLCFTIQGQGLYVEQDTYVSTAELVSSAIDVNVDSDKTWIAAESGFEPLPVGTSVGLDYSIDGGATWVALTGATTTGQTVNRQFIGVKSPNIQFRVTLTPNGAATLAPVLRKAGIGGWPAAKPLGEHVMLVRAYPDFVDRQGTQHNDPLGGWNLLKALRARRNTALVYEFQPPWSPEEVDVLKVRVAGVRTYGPWGANRHEGGLLLLRLKEVA